MKPHPEKSTTVRSIVGAAPAVVRALETLSPSLAGRLAARAFLSAPRTSAPEWERAALARAEPLALRVGQETLGGFRLGEGPAVLLVHGWGGRAGQLAAFAPELLRAGFSVVGFDGPGHGSSSGRISSLVHQAAAVAAAARATEARGAIGHSLGAAALVLAMSRGTPLGAAVLIGTPRSPKSYLDRFCDVLGLGPAGRDAARRSIESRLRTAMDDLDATRAAGALAAPALLVHDRRDGEVPWEEGAAVARAWPGARLVTTEGLGHRRILRDDGVIAAAASFLSEALRPGAPGGERAGTFWFEASRLARAFGEPREGGPGLAA